MYEAFKLYIEPANNELEDMLNNATGNDPVERAAAVVANLRWQYKNLGKEIVEARADLQHECAKRGHAGNTNEFFCSKCERQLRGEL